MVLHLGAVKEPTTLPLDFKQCFARNDYYVI